MSTALTSGRENVAPWVGEPDPLELQDAARDLLPRRPAIPIAVLAVLAAAVGFLLGPAMLVPMLLGVIAFYAALLALYLCWHDVFCSRNLSLGTFCPQCTSRIWEVRCGRCERVVPPLALWLGGLFLPRCPKCDGGLSSRRGELVAWCPTCRRTHAHPRRLFAKPTWVTLWVDDTLPAADRVQRPWEVVSSSPHCLILYEPDDPHSANLLVIRNDYRHWSEPVRKHLIARTRLLLISADIPEIWASRIKGHFDLRRGLVSTVAPIV